MAEQQWRVASVCDGLTLVSCPSPQSFLWRWESLVQVGDGEPVNGEAKM